MILWVIEFVVIWGIGLSQDMGSPLKMYGGATSLDTKVPTIGLYTSTGGIVPCGVPQPHTISINYLKMIGDIHAAQIGYSTGELLKKTYGIGEVVYRYWGKFTYTDEKGEILGHFNAHDIIPGVVLTYASYPLYGGVSWHFPIRIYFKHVAVQSLVNAGVSYIDTSRGIKFTGLLSDLNFYVRKFEDSSVYYFRPSLSLSSEFMVGDGKMWIGFTLYNIQKWGSPYDSSSSTIKALLSLSNLAYHTLIKVRYNINSVSLIITYDIGEKIDRNILTSSFLTGFGFGVLYKSQFMDVVFAIKPVLGSFIVPSLTIEKKMNLPREEKHQDGYNTYSH